MGSQEAAGTQDPAPDERYRAGVRPFSVTQPSRWEWLFLPLSLSRRLLRTSAVPDYPHKVPGYDLIGIWGSVLLTLLRLIQGIGVGGEWGGSVLLAMEWASTNKNRGFIAAWPQFGAPAGLFLANLAVLIFSWISGDQFLVWGWRIPSLLSIVMSASGCGFGSVSSRPRCSVASKKTAWHALRRSRCFDANREKLH